MGNPPFVYTRQLGIAGYRNFLQDNTPKERMTVEIVPSSRWGRFALILGSVAATGLAARSMLVGPVSPLVAAGSISAYLSLLLSGVFEPRMSMFLPWIHHATLPKNVLQCALTFDDGPSVESTARVLDMLGEQGAKATFFVIGRKLSENTTPLLLRMQREGHEIGCHSFAHDRLFALRSGKRMKQDICEALDRIAQVTGETPVFFRPPIMHSTPTLMRVVEELGLIPIGFSVRAYDGVRIADANAILLRITKRLKPGSIVLMHDAAERDDFTPHVLFYLPKLLARLKEKALESVTISTLIQQ